MKILKKLITIISLILSYHTVFPQYHFFKLEFKYSQALETNPNRKIHILIHNPDTTFICNVNSKIVKRKKTNVKEIEKDTSFHISKEEFNKIMEKAINLSSEQIIKGINASNPYIHLHPSSVFIRVSFISGENVSYFVPNPNFSTKDRNLEPFLALCKEILLLAKKKPRDYF